MTPLVWQLVLRYMRGKRSANIVPILSRISIIAIAVSSCAMIVLFSVFNGFEYLVRDLYNAFYPQVKISAVKGKFFTLNDNQLEIIKKTDGVKAYTTVLEDNVLINSNNEQRVATLKGIDKNYFTVNNVRPFVDEGADSVSMEPVPTAIVGRQLLNQLGIEINNAFSDILIHYPNAQSDNISLAPESAFQSLRLKPEGSFMVQEEFDSRYILASLPLVQELLQAEGKYTSVEISADEDADIIAIKKELQQQLGNTFRVQTRFEQNQTLYTVMHSEKWAVYAILLLVLLIASFNMVGALSLLVMEKQKDIAILKAMGAQGQTIKNIFIGEGMLWSLTGGIAGLVLGLGICLGQQYFQWIKLQGNFIIEAYPVTIVWTDFLLVIGTVSVVGILASLYPALRATHAEDPSLKTD
jgi:lipoprotein-releasing system permease protein